MNELTKNDILLKDGVFDIKDDFIFKFYENYISYQDWKLERDFDSIIEENTFCFKIPLLDIEYKIMCPNIYNSRQYHLPYDWSTVLGWNYFFNYFNLGLFDSRIKYVFRNHNYILNDEEFKLKSDEIICDIKNVFEHNQNKWKLFCNIENTYTLSFENFDREEFWDINEEHPLNSNNLFKSFNRKPLSYKISNAKKRCRTIKQEIKDKVWNRDNGKCVQCSTNENLEFDHIIPFSKGGPNTYKNLQLLCQSCNRKKSNKIY